MSKHVMFLHKTYPDGEELWKCPTCGATWMIQWSPWKRDIIVSGDRDASHSGGKGGVSISNIVMTQGSQEESPWNDWLTGVDTDLNGS